MRSDDVVRARVSSSGDAWTFIRSFFDAPLRTGAQWPSGRALARTMAHAVDPTVPGTVLELGVGTGPVTRALIERGIAPQRLMLVETNAAFCALLQSRYHQCRLVQGDALAVPRRLAHESTEPVAAVVSSLPLMAMAPQVRVRLLLDCLRLMGPAGRFVQFTYSVGSPVPLKGLPVHGRASRRIWRNLWPAKVWTYRACADDALA